MGESSINRDADVKDQPDLNTPEPILNSGIRSIPRLVYSLGKFRAAQSAADVLSETPIR